MYTKTYRIFVGILLVGQIMLQGAPDFSRLVKPVKVTTLAQMSDALVSQKKQLMQGQQELQKLAESGPDLLLNRGISRIRANTALGKAARDLIVQVQQRASKVDYVSYPTLQPRLDDMKKELSGFNAALFKAQVAQAIQKIQAGTQELKTALQKIPQVGSVSTPPDDASYEKMTQPFTQGSLKYAEANQQLEALEKQRNEYLKQDPTFAVTLDELKTQLKIMYDLVGQVVARLTPYQQAINRTVAKEMAEEKALKIKQWREQRSLEKKTI